MLDGFSGHSDEYTDGTGQVEMFKLPPKVTSLFLPLHQGIIASFKAGCKYKLLTELVSTVPTYQNLQQMAKHLPSGHAGLQYGCAPHVSDAAELIKESWDNIQRETIEACWKHSKYLVQDTGSTSS